MKEKRLVIEQIDRKIITYKKIEKIAVPTRGWVYSIRKALNMSMRQLGNRMGVTPQSIYQMEERERQGTVTLGVMKEVGSVLEMKFVYGFIPKKYTLKKMIEERAKELATEIILRTSLSMSLEDQAVSERRIKQAIIDKSEELSKNIPRYLWD